jgi:hypothetical protein
VRGAMAGTGRSRRRLRLVGGILVAGALLALVEGAASFVLVGHTVATRTRFTFVDADREFTTRFDPEIGWCGTPGFADPTGFGKEAPVHVNGQGFRGTRDVPREVEKGRVRALLSGDSFTFGTGVADDATWGVGLTRLEPRLETVNLGVGGYGIDQAFLRYRRDGLPLDHDLHLFAFITEDVLRAVVPPAWGAEKPRLVLEGEELRVTGVPVVRAPRWRRTMRQVGGFLRELRTVALLERVAGAGDARPLLGQDVEARTLAVRIFQELGALARERDVTLAIVHLPIESELGGGSADVLRSFFRTECERRGIVFLDLFDEFRALPPEEHASLYLRKPAFGAGHYTAKGHELVAGMIWRKLGALPAVRERLAAAD